MSDFGALLIVKSDSEIQDDEKQTITKQLEALLEEETDPGIYKYENSLGEQFQSTLIELSKNSIAFQLSEYWYGDEDEEEESFDFAKDEDEETAKPLVAAMQSALPKYQFSIEFDEW